MLGYFKDFVLNIFIICSPLAVYPYIHKAKGNKVLYRFFVSILFSLSIMMTMSFPIHLNGLIYDFRSIPLAIGALYGGMQVSICLYVVLMLYRFFLNSPNGLEYVISLLPSFVVLALFYKRFHALSLARKVAVVIVFCSLIKLITFTIYLALIGEMELLLANPMGTLQTYLLQAVIAGLCAYVIHIQDQFFLMQEEMVRSEKLKVVGDMAASVAHEIRNPLTTIRGFIHLFATADLGKEKKETYKRICFEELDRAELIISDYLSLAKPDLEVVEAININHEIHYLANVLMTYANYHNIEIDVKTMKEQEFHIHGDRNKFRQALINIGKNAIEAMQSGGLLVLKTDIRDDHALIVLSDNGSGMAPEQMKRLGTPYYSTKEKGTGLGTMVSFSIIKKMNGKIDIKSELGIGTEFYFSFPKAN
ncbi:ATP-binding protein [Paenibacillus sp. FJAT-27812]|uniref:ATP-binding protein n=1 Tax=Paenibacillus sp. FJAT-27812 TaxID=1684143 RepID=UPI0006A7B4F1|nr:ATP-binding protein [Paenibacillus sp. FJAT-27812]